MKRFLLSAAIVLLSVGVSAQAPQDFLSGKLLKETKASTLKLEKGMKRFSSRGVPEHASGVARAVAAAPEGAKVKYLMTDYEPVYGFLDTDGSDILYPRLRMQELVFADDGKVYVPNMFLAVMLGDAWLEGTSDAEGNIVVESGQHVGSISDMGISADFVVSKVNVSTQEQSLDPIVLEKDAASGAYVLPEGDCVGVFVDYMGMQFFQLYSYCTEITYSDASALPVVEEYDYTYADYDGNAGTGKVEMIDIDGEVIVSGLLPDYPNSLQVIERLDNGDLRAYSNRFVVDDDTHMSVMEIASDGFYTVETADFVYDVADGSYSFGDGLGLADFFSNDGVEFGFSVLYSDLGMVPVPGAGVESVEAGAESEVVATEYYDLSGRRMTEAVSGVGIMVKKYADGTRKATKVMR